MAKRKQTFIEGTEPESIPEIDTAAENYKSIRDRRMTLTAEEVETNGVLLEAMGRHKLKTYKTPTGQVVTVVPGKDKAKVKSAEVDGKGLDD